MRIAILTQFYDPEPEPLPGIFARRMAERGHRVSVITAFPNYPAGKTFPGYQQRLWSRECLDGVEVLRLPIFPDRSASVIRRAACHVSFAASVAGLGAVLARQADVVWVYHPPLTLGPAAAWIGLWKRMPFVLEIQDLYPESLEACDMIRDRGVLRILDRLLGAVYRRAAAVTVISPGFRRVLIDKGVPPEKIHVFPNWADERVYYPRPPDPARAAALGLTGRFNVVYAGNFGPAQDLRNVLRAASRLRDLPHVQFVLVGSGTDHEAIRREAATKRLDNVRVLDRQPETAMPGLYSLADVLLVHLKAHPLFDLTIPSKTQCYLASGRPILMACGGDAADIVRDASAGLVVPPGDPAALASAVRDFYAMPEEARAAMGRAGADYFSRHFTIDRRLDGYERVFQAVARTHGGAGSRRAAPSHID